MFSSRARVLTRLWVSPRASLGVRWYSQVPSYWRLRGQPPAPLPEEEQYQPLPEFFETINGGQVQFLLGVSQLFESLASAIFPCKAGAAPAPEKAGGPAASAAGPFDGSAPDLPPPKLELVESTEVSDTEFLKEVLHPKLYVAVQREIKPDKMPCIDLTVKTATVVDQQAVFDYGISITCAFLLYVCVKSLLSAVMPWFHVVCCQAPRATRLRLKRASCPLVRPSSTCHHLSSLRSACS